MTAQEKQYTIDRLAKYIIPAVFRGEEELMRKHIEWRERLRNVEACNRREVAEAYCRAIAEEIVSNQCEEGGDK